MNARMSSLALATCVVAAIAGCAPADQSSRIVESSRVSLSAHSSEPNLVNVGSSQGLSVQRAWVSWDALRFYGCDGETEQVASGVAVDLTRSASFDFKASGDYCTVSSTFVRAAHPLPQGAPATLIGSTLVIEGALANKTLFSLASEDTQIVRAQSTSGITLGGAPTKLVLTFDLAKAMKGVDLTKAKADSQGVIRLTNTENAALLAAVEQQFLNAATLFVDNDGDGKLGPSDQVVASAD